MTEEKNSRIVEVERHRSTVAKKQRSRESRKAEKQSKGRQRAEKQRSRKSREAGKAESSESREAEKAEKQRSNESREPGTHIKKKKTDPPKEIALPFLKQLELAIALAHLQ